MVIPGTKTEYVLDVPAEKTKRAILFVPGMSGEALGERYARLAELAAESGFALLRTQSWRDTQDLLTKSLKSIHDDLAVCIEFLCREGYTELYAIGKSLGGALLLYGGFQDFKRIVLWAPAANVASKGTVDILWGTPFSQIDSLSNFAISEKGLEQLKTHILLLHGTEDASVSFPKMQTLHTALRHAELEQIHGMGHSPKTPEENQILFFRSINFIEGGDERTGDKQN